MNQKAFNLFTALVAFVMIVLTVILTNSMTQTEDKAIATMTDLESQAEIQAVADLARGDALQVFIYNLRFRIETWLTKEDNWFPLTQPVNRPWDEVVADYVTANFGSSGPNQGRQFAFETTTYLSSLLAIGHTFGRYTVMLEQDDDAMFQALTQTISQSIDDPSKKFFEPIDCEDEYNCNIGTFYVNLDLSLGAFNSNCDPASDPDSTACQEDQEVYESLPKIIVESTTTGDILETAILPRSNLRIYIPLRIFKAVAVTKQVADDQIFKTGSPYRDTMGNVRTGLCDTGCGPRTGNVTQSGGTNWPDHACRDPIATENIGGIPGIIPNYSAQYNPGIIGGAEGSHVALRNIIEALLCGPDSSIKANIDAANPFTTTLVDCEIYDSSPESLQRPISYSGYPAISETTCFRPGTLQVQFKFTEDNELYRVNKHIDRPYIIQVLDSYTLSPETLGLCKTICDDPLCGAAKCEP
ncbi:hypothetical protein KKE06_01150 [Candidatus Micrarchaeota archaeon]|nr:hypothetical protein [Candidatus Micrarchaeota archaeon]MBU1930043.1 hypothetical protein [Candidatus Micrarchaeota archaeon]